MNPLNMVDARRIMHVAVFIEQVLVTLAFVQFSGWLVLYFFHVNLQTMLVLNPIISVFIILDAMYILYVIRCR